MKKKTLFEDGVLGSMQVSCEEMLGTIWGVWAAFVPARKSPPTLMAYLSMIEETYRTGSSVGGEILAVPDSEVAGTYYFAVIRGDIDPVLVAVIIDPIALVDDDDYRAPTLLDIGVFPTGEEFKAFFHGLTRTFDLFQDNTAPYPAHGLDYEEFDWEEALAARTPDAGLPMVIEEERPYIVSNLTGFLLN